jgi:hypothetical protein
MIYVRAKPKARSQRPNFGLMRGGERGRGRGVGKDH